jgi:hypothetical protein
MQVITKVFLVLLTILGTAFAENISFLAYEKNEFSPILKEKFVIPFSISKKSVVKVQIYTPDGTLIRQLGVDTNLKKGKHTILWDGKDENGNSLFSGGFLGLDNIGVFDRSHGLPMGASLDQADGTGWMAFYCTTMMSMAIELAEEDKAYEDLASKFFEHFVQRFLH